LPSGSQWLHEIKHDGFRIIARKDGDRVRFYSRPSNDMKSLAISVPAGETCMLKHFQARMPYGLVVLDVA
jgi:ATP-dependent DNA ligase